MHTIGMDTYPLIADGVAAAEGEVEGRIRPFRWWIRGKTAAGVENPAPPGAGKRRFWRRLPALGGSNGDPEPSRTVLSIRSCCGTTGAGAFGSAGGQSIGIHSNGIDTNPMEYIRNGTDCIGMQCFPYQWMAIDHAARRWSGINDGGPAAFHHNAANVVITAGDHHAQLRHLQR